MTQLELSRGMSPIDQMRSMLPAGARTAAQNTAADGISFEEMLTRKQQELSGGLKFSRHANERLESRQIDLTDGQLERLQGAVRKAEAKGIRDSLVMLDNVAFIVNVKSNTVVTAVAGEDEKIFSNIDGAVIV